MANSEGLLAVGGDLSEARLITAYGLGIFPWFNEEDPLLWWSPDPRFCLFPDKLKISSSMRPLFNQQKYRVTFDTNFEAVMRACQSIYRPGQRGSWITEEMIAAYTNLHHKGLAHSVEVWEGKTLVGGLYGIALGHCFFGESMFAFKSNASKFGFITLVLLLRSKGFTLVDCQQETRHLGSMGAQLVPRTTFLDLLVDATAHPNFQFAWTDWMTGVGNILDLQAK